MRLFLAISLEGSIRQSLLTLQEQWKTIGVKGHFVPPENFHITLAFIGEYGNLDTVMDAISTLTFQPFSISLDGAGTFRDTYWAGITKNDVLNSCVRKLRRSLAQEGIPYDRKNFAPHITLVRKAEFNNKIELLLEHLPAGSMEVHEISLMRSDRGKNGMIYTPIENLTF